MFDREQLDMADINRVGVLTSAISEMETMLTSAFAAALSAEERTHPLEREEVLKAKRKRSDAFIILGNPV